MMITDDKYIPVDDAMERFENHLLSHDRVIFSAKFGDGKTFFLNKFEEKCKKSPNSPFEFVTLYPVNYQVLVNKDIFELIKHNVLLQILQLGMIDTNYEVTDKMAFEFYVQSHFCSVAESFFSMLNELGADDLFTNSLFGIFKTIGWFKSLKDKVSELKQKSAQTEFLDKYLSTFDENSVYENDIITKIIRDNIQAYQNKHNKKVVLVIEDMDRLDPAHLFRIMNVFSAHMDYGYRSLQSTDDTLIDNKFGVSNVVFVMHAENTEAIFHHFYGNGADYEGYMSKFYNKDIFHFSLAEEKEKYALNLIIKMTGLSEDKLGEFFSTGFFENVTMRSIKFALDKVDEQFQSLELKPGVKANPQLLRVIVIAKRLGVGNDRIISVLAKHFRNLDRFYVDRLLPLMILNSRTNVLTGQLYVQDKQYGGCRLVVENIGDNGLCTPVIFTDYSPSDDGKDLMQKLSKMLALLGY